MWVRRMGRISPGNFTAQAISDFILLVLKDFVKDIEKPEIDVLEPTQRVRFRQKRKHVIATLTDNSVLHILGLDKQTTRVNVPGKPSVEYMVFDASETVISEQAPQLKRVTSILVYSDIVELSLVGDTQVLLLGFFPIKSQFGDRAYWSFNPPYYIRLREWQVTTITIQLCDKTCEAFPIADG